MLVAGLLAIRRKTVLLLLSAEASITILLGLAASLINDLLHMVGHISILLTIVDITPFLLLHNVDIARIIDIESEVVTRLVRTIMCCI